MEDDNTSLKFDAFGSYRWSDTQQVEQIIKSLQAHRITVFLDRWYLSPGRPWPQILEQVLTECGSAIIFIGPKGLGRWQQREQYLALDRQTKEDIFPVIPVLLPGSDPPLGILKLNTWVDLRNGIDDPDQLEILRSAIRGAVPNLDTQKRISDVLADVCPFRGLKSFREEDAAFFYGREKDVNLLCKIVVEKPFVMVVGASGCGKSSLVRAGLLPRLRRPSAEVVWDIATMFPRDRPLHSLAATLLPFLEPGRSWTETDRFIEVNKLAEALLKSQISLSDVVVRVLEKQNGTDRLLLFVDQWEELYTQCGDEQHRQIFLDHILDASSSGPLTLVATLRGDFFGHALANRQLSERMQGSIINLGPMLREELESSITVPAQKVGLGFEAGLVDRIISDVGNEPGNLPLLEFVLTELWKNRRANNLCHKAYESMNGVRGAIASRAEALFNSLGNKEKEMAHRIMIQMVHPGEGTEDTRRRAHFEIDDLAIQPVIKTLIDGRLLVTGHDEATGLETFELTHEALIRNWQRLKDWLKVDREFLRTKERIELAATEWDREGRNRDRLLSPGRPLNEGQALLIERKHELDHLLIEFIETSKKNQMHRVRLQRAGIVAILFLFVSAIMAGNGWWLRMNGLSYYDQYARLIAKFGFYLVPEMVFVPSGTLLIESSDEINVVRDRNNTLKASSAFPISMPNDLLVGKYEITFAEYDVFAISTDRRLPETPNYGRGRLPVVNVSWEDAVAYTKWLSTKTGKKFRLPNDTEWEYAARAGTIGRYWWCEDTNPFCDIIKGSANCDGCGSQWDGLQAAPVGSFKPNSFGLYDTSGNVWEWVLDCWHTTYSEISNNGALRGFKDCRHQVVRGGSWVDPPEFVSSSERLLVESWIPSQYIGFRVVQEKN